jgi:hypothetical protein
VALAESRELGPFASPCKNVGVTARPIDVATVSLKKVLLFCSGFFIRISVGFR